MYSLTSSEVDRVATATYKEHVNDLLKNGTLDEKIAYWRQESSRLPHESDKGRHIQKALEDFIFNKDGSRKITTNDILLFIAVNTEFLPNEATPQDLTDDVVLKMSKLGVI